MKWFMWVCAILPLAAVAGTVYEVHSDDSIQDAIDGAASGDTVVVYPGTYEENLVLKAGVSVRSTAGSGSTTIDAGSLAVAAVTFTGGGSGMLFGAASKGFTIEGGTGCGLYLSASSMSVTDLIIGRTSGACVKLEYCASTLTLDYLQLRGGVHALYCQSSISNSTITNQSGNGILLEFTNPPGLQLEEVILDSCATGVHIHDSGISLTDCTLQYCDTGIDASNNYPTHECTIAIGGGTTSYCETAVLATEGYGTGVDLAADGLEVSYCTDGLVLEACAGTIEDCTFDQIRDTAITLSEYRDDLTIGGTNPNTFTDVDGVGILVGAGAEVTIAENAFAGVLGSAVEVQSGATGTTIHDCDMDGDDGCFQGVYTTEPGTYALVRDCTLYDYTGHVSPLPRGAAARRATGDFGTRDDWGNNSFSSNSIDLQYINRDANPDSLYAVGNWWGESPPNAASFAGCTGYIVYSPWDSSAARPMSAGDAGRPERVALISLAPNPANQSIDITCVVPAGEWAEVTIWDLQGRRVATVLDACLATGEAKARWDGTDAAGVSCASGAYVCRITCAVGSANQEFALVR